MLRSKVRSTPKNGCEAYWRDAPSTDIGFSAQYRREEPKAGVLETRHVHDSRGGRQAFAVICYAIADEPAFHVRKDGHVACFENLIDPQHN